MNWWQRALVRLAGVEVVDVGRKADGLTSLLWSGTELDKPWGELQTEFQDALEAWRRNPLARRLVGLLTSYVVGDGFSLGSTEDAASRFLADFWGDPHNDMGVRQYAMCDELSRAGELFVTLHLNPASGMSYVRLIPASRIDRITWAPGDYEAELTYHEVVGVEDADYAAGGRTWLSPAHPDADARGADGRYGPVCLHFAVNRPAGCVRGESDLAPVLPWLRRYSRWLEDRTQLNAAVRAFLWMVKVPGRQVQAKIAQYRTPPAAGSVLVVDRDNEEWQAVAPGLNAGDASADGRALRWMVAAGGPGIGLTDFGEAESSNLATARAMGDQRTRFMTARQRYFGRVLATIAATAYNRAVRLGLAEGPEIGPGAVEVRAADIAPGDNQELARAAADIAQALAGLGLAGRAGRRLAVRLVLKFAGETVSDEELEALVGGGAADVGQADGPGVVPGHRT